MRRKPRVLLVEDSEDVREIYAMCMRAAGWAADAVSNAFDALERAMETIPDVIIMDLHMPGLDGVETTRLLKTDPRTAHIPIIACTAFWSDQKAGAHAFDGVVKKPCEPDELLAYVERFFTERESS
jgi:CheY-like chemotaxis protein